MAAAGRTLSSDFRNRLKYSTYISLQYVAMRTLYTGNTSHYGEYFIICRSTLYDNEAAFAFNYLFTDNACIASFRVVGKYI